MTYIMNLIVLDFTIWCGRSIHQRTKHFIHVGILVLFSSLLMAFDIGSDILTGLDYLETGHPKWATFTFSIICSPWLARILISLASLRICFSRSSKTSTSSLCCVGFSNEGYFLWKQEMIDSLLEFPLLQPIRLVNFGKHFFVVHSLDVTASCICEIHCLGLDWFNLNTVNQLISKEKKSWRSCM